MCLQLQGSYRWVSKGKKILFQQLSEANVSTSQQIYVMDIEYGGSQNIAYIKKCIRNYKRGLKEEMEGIDAKTFIDFLTSEKKENPSFYLDLDKYNAD